MSTELSHIELMGPAGFGGGHSDRPENTISGYMRWPRFWLPVAVVAALGAWMMQSGRASKPAESVPVHLATATAPEPAPSAATAQAGAAIDPAATPLEAIAPVEAPPIDGLRIASQSWRRGGLGSNALVTLTLRNSNDYAVKDIQITCAFARRDGSHLTDRSRVIPDAVNRRSRRTFARMHVGFVNVNADKAKCALVGASRA